MIELQNNRDNKRRGLVTKFPNEVIYETMRVVHVTSKKRTQIT